MISRSRGESGQQKSAGLDRPADWFFSDTVWDLRSEHACKQREHHTKKHNGCQNQADDADRLFHSAASGSASAAGSVFSAATTEDFPIER